MPWRPLPRIAFAVAVYPFQPSSPADLPLELGDELYIIEQGGLDGSWYRGYLVAPPSLLAGLTSIKGQTLEARVFSGIFPRSCVEIREVLGSVPLDGGEQDGVRGGTPRTSITNGIYVTPRLSDDYGQAGNRSGVDGQYGSHKRSSVKNRTSTARTHRPASRSDSAARDSQMRTWSREEKHRDNDGTTADRFGQTAMSSTSPDSGLPLTPVSMSPRAPDAPKPPAPVPMLKIGDETPTSISEPLVDEIASCLREWHSTNLHELLLARRYSVLERMSSLIEHLDLSRRQLLHGVLTTHELKHLREQTVWDLVSGNKMMNGEVIVRDPNRRGRLLTGDDSAIEITRLQSIMSLLEARPVLQVDVVTLHHLLVDVKSIVGVIEEPTTFMMSLYSKRAGESPIPLSESYAIDVVSHGALTSIVGTEKTKTLMTDLSSTDIGEGSGQGTELLLVVKVQKNLPPSTTFPSFFRDSTSIDGTTEDRDAANPKPSGHNSMSGGRRSLMWGQKQRGPSYWGRTSQRSRAGHPPNSSDSNSSGQSDERPITPAAVALPRLKRNVGVGILNLGPLVRQGRETDQTISLWTPNGTSGHDEDGPEGWTEVIHELAESRTGRYKKLDGIDHLQLHLHPFINSDAESLVKSTPTLLHDVTVTPKVGFSGAPTRYRSDIYITISEIVLPAHALLSHPQRGTMPVSQGSSLKNIQLTLEVRNISGERIDHCIYPSSNSVGHTAWRTVAVEQGERWNQTIKLAIPPEDVPGSHLIMSIADAPSFPFALCWMPLWDQQAFVKDGYHSLVLHHYDRSTSSTDSGRGAYLDLPWSAKGRPDLSKDELVTGPMATLQLRTYLCSTRFSQDVVLLGLLKWREKSPSQLLESLEHVMFVPELEVVKLLSEVFDALFGILVDHAGQDEFEDLVFDALVTVLGIVHDRRFNLGPLVDDYAENRFNYPFATPCLVRSFTRLLSTPSNPQKSRSLHATIKVGRHILKFIISARHQQKAKEAGIGITSTQSTFHRDLHTIFKALEALMRNPAPILVGSKTLVVQHFQGWLPELTGVFTDDEILRLAINFMDSSAQVEGKLIMYRLVLLLNFYTLDCFREPTVRRKLILSTVRWLSPYWGETRHVTGQWREQVRLCCSVVSQHITELGPELSDYLPKVVESYRSLQTTNLPVQEPLSLLFSKAYPFQTRSVKQRPTFDEALVELAAILATSSKMSSHFQINLQGMELAHFISETLHTYTSILGCDAYPKSWLSVHIYHHRSTLKMLDYLFAVLAQSFLPHPDDADAFNTEIWRLFFTTLLKLVGSDALALETFPEQKRRAVWKIAGDVRENGAELLRRSWEAIGWETTSEDRGRYGLERMGGYQVQYVPGLVGPIMELCLSVHEGLRSVAVGILQTMLVSEWTLSEDLSVIQAEIIECLDLIFKSKHISESVLQKLFIGELLDLFEPLAQLPAEPLWTAVKDVVVTIDELLDLLGAVHNSETAETFQIMHTLRLMEFLRDMQKEDIFIRYVHQLAHIQAEAHNYTEAGLALRLHAELHAWDPTHVVPPLTEPMYPEQSSFERRECIYFDMIKHYEDDRAWDNALACYRELADQYEANVFDYSKLARAQRAMAKIFENIAKGERQYSRYYRVVYKGLGFPIGLRNKEFIFEASHSDRLQAFTDRMQQQHPSAQILLPGIIEDVEGQFLQIYPVSPYRDLQHPVYKRSKVPQPIRDHLLTSQLSQFAVTTRRNGMSSDVKDQWIEKTVYTTADVFPTILRRSEIVATDVVRLSPLQAAVERTWRKTQELSALEKRIAESDDSAFDPLTEALSLLVDPSASTKVSHYRQFLPAERKKAMHYDEGKDAASTDSMEIALEVALMEHVITIKRCLNLYSRSAHQATQADLLRSKFYLCPLRSLWLIRNTDFETTFAPELTSLASTPQEQRSRQASRLGGVSPALRNEPPLIDTSQPNELPSSEPEAQHRLSRHEKHSKHEKNRLSLGFLKRNPPDPPEMKVNGGTDTSTDDGTSTSGTTRSRSKSGSRSKSANRRSFFRGPEDDSAPSRTYDGQRNVGDDRADTAQSSPSSTSHKGGNVKKRLSLLKIGKKGSKASVGVGSVAEE